jgi:hypothetical protein
MARDIRLELDDVTPPDLVEAFCDQLPEDWSRDGILEHQVSTREEVQYCFRHAGHDEWPRCALCLAGPSETWTVAAVVPIDRGVELSDDQTDAIVEDFYTSVVEPVVASLDASARLRDVDER